MGVLSVKSSRYPSDSGLRWKDINVLWLRSTAQLVANVNIKIPFLRAYYQQGFDQGVTYFESRKNLAYYPLEELYMLDTNPAYNESNGKHYLDLNGDRAIDLTLDLIKNVSLENPDFIGHRRISYSHRQLPSDIFNNEMLNVVRLYQKYPDHVAGYDLVGQEDAGNSHLFYLKNLLELYNNVTGLSTVPLYMHTAETNWPDDLIPSVNDFDPVSTLQNTYEVLMLNSKRIGHGVGFIKHPYLLEVIRKRGIAIEVCAVSNQMLGYTPDIRNHPALHYFRSGIPIVFGADDPGTFGYDNITVDWYDVFMAWGLDLADLKTLAINSLNYSAMSVAQKQVAIEQKWQPMWNRYIAATKSVACSRQYTETPPIFARLLPRAGAISGTTKVHVFGRHFQSAICKNLLCKFGAIISTSAHYVSNTHIICLAPDTSGTNPGTVSVTVALDGSNFFTTGLNFTYKDAPITLTLTTTAAAPVNCQNSGIVSGATSFSFTSIFHGVIPASLMFFLDVVLYGLIRV